MPEIPMDIWYEYFLERGGRDIGISRFQDLFIQILSKGQTMIAGPRGIKYVSFGSAITNFYKYYNEKFNTCES